MINTPKEPDERDINTGSGDYHEDRRNTRMGDGNVIEKIGGDYFQGNINQLSIYNPANLPNKSSINQKPCFVLVQDSLYPIDIESILDSLKPNFPLTNPTIIRPPVGKIPWFEAATYQEKVIGEVMVQSRALSVSRFAVFSLAQIPLVIHLGFLLSDGVEVLYFQFDRNQKSWHWPHLEGLEVDYDIKVAGLPKKLIEDKIEVVVRISLSARIHKQDTDAAVLNIPVEIDIFVDKPNVMWLRSPKQLTKLSEIFQQVLLTIRKKVPFCSRIHLFYAGPTGGGIVIGQQINPRMNPPVEVYEYSRNSVPCYKLGLTLVN